MSGVSDPKLVLIAAACRNMGIGNKGDLPWRLKKEMAYFTKISSRSSTENKQNAVIMGRKTWFSIPAKMRPLSNRINIVISSTLKDLPEGAHHLAHSLNDAIDLTREPTLQSKVDKLIIVGGEQVYKESLQSSYCHRIYLTRIDADFECDTFFPEIDSTKFKLINDPEVPLEEQEENGIKYKYELYEKINSQ